MRIRHMISVMRAAALVSIVAVMLASISSGFQPQQVTFAQEDEQYEGSLQYDPLELEPA